MIASLCLYRNFEALLTSSGLRNILIATSHEYQLLKKKVFHSRINVFMHDCFV